MCEYSVAYIYIYTRTVRKYIFCNVFLYVYVIIIIVILLRCSITKSTMLLKFGALEQEDFK